MRIQVEKFLAITALLASTAALGVGCTTEDTTTNTDAGVGGGGAGAGGTAGAATGGAAGTAATGGTAGAATGGTAGAAGGGGAAGAAGAAGGDGGACLGDAGNEMVDCTALPYYGEVCGDAGAEGVINPLGVDLCNYLVGWGRPGVIEKTYDCLKAIPAGGCTSTHDAAVQKCMDDNFALACEKPPMSDGDGGTYYPCKDIADSCPPDDAGQGGITEADCNFVLNALSDASVNYILTCYDTPVGACADDFVNCVGLP